VTSLPRSFFVKAEKGGSFGARAVGLRTEAQGPKGQALQQEAPCGEDPDEKDVRRKGKEKERRKKERKEGKKERKATAL
jgi:hypothetical protein